MLTLHQSIVDVYHPEIRAVKEGTMREVGLYIAAKICLAHSSLSV